MNEKKYNAQNKLYYCNYLQVVKNNLEKILNLSMTSLIEKEKLMLIVHIPYAIRPNVEAVDDNEIGIRCIQSVYVCNYITNINLDMKTRFP